jgi:hypothetical protein
VSLKTPRDAAAFNANKLVEEPMSWKHIFQLGIGAFVFAIIDLSDAVREHES